MVTVGWCLVLLRSGPMRWCQKSNPQLGVQASLGPTELGQVSAQNILWAGTGPPPRVNWPRTNVPPTSISP
ncbi:unnamed protein product [Staurois parvus]|uniref:Secreted protein n=1 Tax=Staurois parvus TaxID=386267 RepID=A0ABN9AGM4_9NEOB|nr:unnamed protein product [Staurois parvus]